jgi:asparagine synthase (glutamine-hydrolysing)
MRIDVSNDRLNKLAKVISAATPADGYMRLISHWPPGANPVVDATPRPSIADSVNDWPALGGITEQMMALDAVGYLPDDILVKVDRASMAHGLETRVPMLDHRVYEFAWSLPLNFKISDGVSKRVLRSVARRRVPAAILDRPKAGFAVPIGSWLRGPLRDWADDLLSTDRLQRQGLLDAQAVGRAWTKHRSGDQDLEHQLWDVLMLQAWLISASSGS